MSKALRILAPILSHVLSIICVLLVAYCYALMLYALAPEFPV